MTTITMRAFQNDPELHLRLLQAAHRERARVLHAGFVWLRDHLTPRLHASDWAGRLG